MIERETLMADADKIRVKVTVRPRAKAKVQAIARKVMPKEDLVGSAVIPWNTHDTCTYSLCPRTSDKLATFDMDGTLYDEDSPLFTLDKLSRLHEDGYTIVVFSNQYGITKGKTTHNKVQERFHVLREVLHGIPISIFYATAKDKYRKPMTGMYDLYCELTGFKREPVGRNVFYCGDAAGRSGDFAVSDRYFADNCSMEFYLPGLEVSIDPAPKYQLYKDIRPILEPKSMKIDFPETDKPVLILMVGPQGSGKSTLSKLLYSKRAGYTILSNDSSSGSFVRKRFSDLVRERCNIIINNTNFKLEHRAQFLCEVAGKYYVRCYFFDIPKGLSTHMCHMRVQLGGKYIPPVARHTYYKHLVRPQEREGIDEIVTITRTPQYEGLDVPTEYYYQYNLKER